MSLNRLEELEPRPTRARAVTRRPIPTGPRRLTVPGLALEVIGFGALAAWLTLEAIRCGASGLP